MRSTTPCGVSGHDSDCLCDVKITSPTPINYSLTDLDHADIICKYQRLGVPWDAEQMVALMDGLLVAQEALQSFESSRCDKQQADRRATAVAMLSTCGSVFQAADRLGRTVGDLIRDISRDQPAGYWAWSDEDWLEFEVRIFDDKLNVSALSRDFGLNRNSIYVLLEAYGLR